MAPNQAPEAIDADGRTFSDAVTRLRLPKPVGAIWDSMDRMSPWDCGDVQEFAVGIYSSISSHLQLHLPLPQVHVHLTSEYAISSLITLFASSPSTSMSNMQYYLVFLLRQYKLEYQHGIHG